jgi:hypothetical protein
MPRRIFNLQDEIDLIKAKFQDGEFENFANTQEIAHEMLFDFGFCQKAVIESQLASRKQVATVIRNNKKGRLLHQPGRRSILNYDELQELYDWIDYRIYRHEQPKGYEVENEVLFCCVFQSFSFFFFEAISIMERNKARGGVIPKLSLGWGIHLILRSKCYKFVGGHFLDVKRLSACTVSNLQPFFDELKSHIMDEEGNIIIHPLDTYNLDETNTQLEERSGRVVELVGSNQKATRKEPSRMVNTTVTMCCSAFGRFLSY